MNKVVLLGRLTAEPEMYRATGENANVNARFTVAVNRPFKNAEGGYDADFIRCVAWRNNAEFIEKYFHKGNMIALDGRIQTGSYTNKDGQRVFTTEVMVDHVEFAGSKNSGDQTTGNGTSYTHDTSFVDVPEGVDDEGLPF